MSTTGLAIAAGIAPLLTGTMALPALHSASEAQEAAAVEIIAARPDAAERMTVPVTIGARGPFRFMVDTGAQNTVVSSSLANDLRLPAGPPARVVGVAGELRVGTVELDEILLGRRSAYGLRAPTLDRGHIGADGILGIDSLLGQRVLFDFRRNLIVLHDVRGSAGYEIVVRGKRKGSQLLITDAEIDGIRTSIVIDTGADASIGNRALQRAMARRMTTTPAMLNSVTGQQMAADIGLARHLAVGELGLSNVAVAFADTPAFAALGLDRKPALLLGMHELRAFDRVAIDFAAWKVLFDLPERR